MTRLRLTIIAAVLLVVTAMAGSLLVYNKDKLAELSSRLAESLGMTVKLSELYSPPTVSKETTFVTEPVDADGFVDYYAALNQRASEGVTTDNNAAVLFVKAGIGLSRVDPQRRERYCQMLGINDSDLMEPGFQSYDDFTDEEESSLTTAQENPWSATQHPRVHAWLESNKAMLGLIFEATRRPRFYFPLIPDADDRMIIRTPLDFSRNGNAAARYLAARSMLYIAEGKTAEALQDLLACHRLGRLMGEAPFLMCSIVGMWVESLACDGEATLLQQLRMSRSDALEFQRHLQLLPPLTPAFDKVDFAERLSLLDMVMWKERESDASFPFIAMGVEKEIRVRLSTICDESLRFCNEQFDLFIDAGRLPKYSERNAALTTLLTKLKETARDIKGGEETSPDLGAAMKRRLDAMKNRTPKEMGRAVGEMYFTFLFPAVDLASRSESRLRMRCELLQVGFGLAAYYAEHVEYPERLEKLVPNFISQVPRDRFNEQPLHYVKKDGGYVLYSVGLNSIDDGGQTSTNEGGSDDLVLRIVPTK